MEIALRQALAERVISNLHVYVWRVRVGGCLSSCRCCKKRCYITMITLQSSHRRKIQTIFRPTSHQTTTSSVPVKFHCTQHVYVWEEESAVSYRDGGPRSMLAETDLENTWSEGDICRECEWALRSGWQGFEWARFVDRAVLPRRQPTSGPTGLLVLSARLCFPERPHEKTLEAFEDLTT